MRRLSLLLPALLLALTACSKDDSRAFCTDFAEGTVREHYGMEKPQFCDDRDGRLYVYVKIGEQDWMAENLAYISLGSKCYDGKPENCEAYGRLYKWDSYLKACPKGWHLPSVEEFDALARYADGAGGTAGGGKLKAASGWSARSGNGTDDFGFSAIPAPTGMNAIDPDRIGEWWSSSVRNTQRCLCDESGGICKERDLFVIQGGSGWMYAGNCSYSFASVRCVR